MADEIAVYLVLCDNYYNQYVARIYDNFDDAEKYIKKVLPLSSGTEFFIERNYLVIH